MHEPFELEDPELLSLRQSPNYDPPFRGFIILLDSTQQTTAPDLSPSFVNAA
jgi:hypothetical protein